MGTIWVSENPGSIPTAAWSLLLRSRKGAVPCHLALGTENSHWPILFNGKGTVSGASKKVLAHRLLHHSAKPH